MNTRISSAIETSVYVLVTVMTPRYSTADPYSFLHPSRQTPLRRNRSGGRPTRLIEFGRLALIEVCG